MEEIINNTTNVIQEKKTVKAEKQSLDYPIIKIQLPKEAAIKVQEAVGKLKERKSDFKIEDLLHDFLNELSEKYLEDKIDQYTPDEYYLEAANKIPELRDLIIEKAKTALGKGILYKKRGRRPNSKKITTEEIKDIIDAPNNT